jgi:hypothetical protein
MARNRSEHSTLSSGLPAVAPTTSSTEEETMFVVGIDPHRGSHTAAVLDEDETLLSELMATADAGQRRRLLAFAEPFTPRVWAVEDATGTGALLAQQLVAGSVR